MFSARQPAPGGGLPEPIFSEPLPQGSDYHQLVERALHRDIIHGRLLSTDGRLALPRSDNGRENEEVLAALSVPLPTRDDLNSPKRRLVHLAS